MLKLLFFDREAATLFGISPARHIPDLRQSLVHKRRDAAITFDDTLNKSLPPFSSIDAHE
jgi:hypothetical protein